MITRPQRLQLLELLQQIPHIDAVENRDSLLLDLPQTLRNSIPRSAAAQTDLIKIVETCCMWRLDPNDLSPLYNLIDNAIELVKDSILAADLRRFQDLLIPSQQHLPKTCPYPGLQPFTREDRSVFYGREAEIDQLEKLVYSQQIALLLGPSGVGKSSLIAAGLVPRLEEQGWRVDLIRPGPEPLYTLADRLGLTTPTATAASLAPEDWSIILADQSRLVTACTPQEQRLLIIDPLEELFTQTPTREIHQAFLRTLYGLVTQSYCRVLLVLRVDFYGALWDTELWTSLDQATIKIIPLRDKALREAIVKPAQETQVTLDVDLVERLIADAANAPGALPLVQETLRLLWRQATHNHLTLAAYEQLSNDPAQRLGAALVASAEQTWTRMIGAQQQMAQRILLHLIQPGTEGPATRRQRSVAELRNICGEQASIFHDTLERLVAGRLATVGEELTETESRSSLPLSAAVDLAHETLITVWPRLATWLKAQQTALQLRTRLEYWVKDWRSENLQEVGLLDSVRAKEAAEWIKQAPALNLGIPVGLRDLVERSEKVLAQAEQEKQEYIRALERKTEEARALALASVATDLLNSNPERALLLAQEAVALLERMSISPSAPVISTLHHILNAWPLLHTLRGHHDWVNHVALSPDGTRLVTASEDGTARLWDTWTGQELFVLYGHTAEVTCAMFSPDGTRVVTAGVDGTPRLWEVATGQLQAVLQVHQAPVLYIDFSPEGMWVVTACEDGSTRIWNTHTGQEQHTLQGPTDGVNHAVFSPDGLWLVTAGEDGTTCIWDYRNGQIRGVLRGSAPVQQAVFSPEGREVVTTHADGTAYVWDAGLGTERVRLCGRAGIVNHAVVTSDGKQVLIAGEDGIIQSWETAAGQELSRIEGNAGVIYQMACSQDGHRVVTAGADGTACLWEVATGHLRILRGHTAAIQQVAFSPGGEWVITASADGTARIWSAITGWERALLNGHTGSVNRAVYSPDGVQVLTASDDRSVRVWIAANGQELAILRGHTDWVSQAVYDPEGSHILTASDDHSARLWGTATDQIQLMLKGHTGDVNQAVFSPDGIWVLTASDDATVRIWSAATGQVQRVLQGHTEAVLYAAFSPDGQQVVSTSADGTARLWTVVSHQEPRVLQGHDDTVWYAEFSPDGMRLVTASEDCTARIWDSVTAEELAVLKGHNAVINYAGFNPAGTNIVTASGDGVVRIWDAATGSERAVLRGHERAVNYAAYNPSGTLIATVSDDQTVRIWNAVTMQIQMVLHGHTDWVQHVAFSPDGRYLVTASADGTSRQYILDTDELLDVAAHRTRRQFTAEERVRYLDDNVHDA